MAKQKIPVIADTREQLVWELNDDEFAVERGTLATGDYSVKGLELFSIACERKSLGDFVSTVISQWPRFRRELTRLGAFDHPLIVVEANLADILDHRYESDANPASVLGRLNSIMLDYGIPVVLWGPRELAITAVESWLKLAVKKCGGLPT